MRYKKEYEKAITEPEETRLNRLDLPVCERCKGRLAGYQVDLGNDKILRLCRDCCIEELTSE